MLIISVFFFIVLFPKSQMIKVCIYIEENIRKYSDYYKDFENNQNITDNPVNLGILNSNTIITTKKM